jgi:DNA-binding response OmpR family regulator
VTTNILLAEDDHNFGTILKRELEEESYTVDHVSNGVEAVLKCISHPYDCILLDMVMPVLGGIGALKIIKKLNRTVPVIIMSGNAGSKEMAESIVCGAAKCLIKPFEIAQLKKDIKDNL